MREHSLTTGKISTAFWRFAAPLLFANLLQALYGAADLYVVGKFDVAAAISAVSVGSQVMQAITSIVLGISMGGTVLIARCVGERNHEHAARAIGSLAVLLAAVAAALTPVMLLCIDKAVALLNTPTAAVGFAKQYLTICICGIPFIVGYNAVSGIFRGLGDSKRPLIFIAVACAVNVAVDFILVGGFSMGAAGAAVATVAAQAISFFAALAYLRHRGFGFAFRRRHWKPDASSLGRILRVGSPLALQDVLVNVSFLMITAIINNMGVVASAAVGVVEKIIIFAMLPPAAFGAAVATMTAQNLGAGQPRRARQAMVYSIGCSLVIGIAVCVYAQFLPQTLTSIFSNEQPVIAAAAQYLRSFSFDCILVAFVFNLNAYFNGSDRATVTLVHSLISTFGVRIPVTMYMSSLPDTGLFEMGLAAPIATLVSVLICAVYFWRCQRRQAVARPEAV